MADSASCRALQRHGSTNLLTAGREALDLEDPLAVRTWFEAQQPEVVLLAAALTGADPALTVLGAKLSWAFGRSRDALAQLQELHRHLRSHRQIRAAEQLRQQVGRFWPSIAPPVVRTLHHVACSGGTLISRYLAALPDVVLLSELNPANRYGADAWVAGLRALRLAAAKPW